MAQLVKFWASLITISIVAAGLKCQTV